MSGFARQPPGLVPLFFAELWERFSFYGLNALLVLYLVLPTAAGGAGYQTGTAVEIYGNYTMSVYFLSVLGGYVADRFLGPAIAVVSGGAVIVIGHACMACGPLPLLFVGLACVAVGTGLLKPNISVLVGALYAPEDTRRDAGFSIFYMGINIGAFLAPLLCGYFAQSEHFRKALARAGLDPRSAWQWGFGIAGAGMSLGLTVLLVHWFRVGFPRRGPLRSRVALTPLPRDTLSRLASIAFFCAAAVVFFSVMKQTGSTLSLFADRFTCNDVRGWRIPSSWYQSAGPAFVILLAPWLSRLWVALGPRQPGGAAKMTLGLSAAAVALLVLMLAARSAGDGCVSPAWLLTVYFIVTLGELCLGPVGLSNISRLAPPTVAGVMVAAWFAAIGLGSKLAAMLARHAHPDDATTLATAAGLEALILAGVCAIAVALLPRLTRMMSTIPTPGLAH